MQYYFDNGGSLSGADAENGTWKLPDKTKQMGGIEPTVRIFLEDYVYTYLYQYARSASGREKIAVLVGRRTELDGQDVFLISGAIQGKEAEQNNGFLSFGEQTREYIKTQLNAHFAGLEILGWAHCQPGFGAFLAAQDEKYHRECFSEGRQIFFVVDAADRLDGFYIPNEEGTGLRPAKGYFIYYDKNEEMQEYMLENTLIRPRETQRKEEPKAPVQKAETGEKRKPTQEERMDAAEEIRRILQNRTRSAKKAKRTRYTLLTGISCVLCAACVCMGAAAYHGLNRLKTMEQKVAVMQSSYVALAKEMEEKTQTVFAQTTPPAMTEREEEMQTLVMTEQKTYCVESGDTLEGISRKFYGGGEGVEKIMEANGLDDPNRIILGQELLIP